MKARLGQLVFKGMKELHLLFLDLDYSHMDAAVMNHGAMYLCLAHVSVVCCNSHQKKCVYLCERYCFKINKQNCSSTNKPK